MRDKTVEERQACVAVDENFSMQNSFFRGSKTMRDNKEFKILDGMIAAECEIRL
jgi:hypothetical protein